MLGLSQSISLIVKIHHIFTTSDITSLKKSIVGFRVKYFYVKLCFLNGTLSNCLVVVNKCLEMIHDHEFTCGSCIQTELSIH